MLVLIMSLYPYISIHTPTRGATTIRYKSNIRSLISIHAPTRGATHLLPQREISSVFQSTLPRGERHCPESGVPAAVQFQSTLPRGERPGIDHCHDLLQEFQSTLPRGERLIPSVINLSYYLISIHAPTRGATMGCPGSLEGSDISIHAPTRGATGRYDHRHT